MPECLSVHGDTGCGRERTLLAACRTFLVAHCVEEEEELSQPLWLASAAWLWTQAVGDNSTQTHGRQRSYHVSKKGL